MNAKWILRILLSQAFTVAILFPLPSHASKDCSSESTVHCLLTKSLQQLSDHTEEKKQPLQQEELTELAYEAFFHNDKKVFNTIIRQLKKHNLTLSRSLPITLNKLSTILSSDNLTISTLNKLTFPSPSIHRLAKEEVILHLINSGSHSAIDDALKNNPTILTDSLQWHAENYYYLTLIRDVALTKSNAVKRQLIQHLAQAPEAQHQQRNLQIALMETLGGALIQGDATRKKSNIDGFSSPHLTLLNNRILFYQKFLDFYNTKIGLNKANCLDPIATTSHAIDVFFDKKNKRLIQEIDKLTRQKANDYLIASITLRHINHCTPLSNFFLQRYLKAISETTSSIEIIRYLRSLRRYSHHAITARSGRNY